MEQLEKHRRPRKTKREKMEEEFVKIGETIEQYKVDLAALEERRQAIKDEIEQEEFREMTKFLKERNFTMDRLRELLEGKETRKICEEVVQ